MIVILLIQKTPDCIQQAGRRAIIRDPNSCIHTEFFHNWKPQSSHFQNPVFHLQAHQLDHILLCLLLYSHTEEKVGGDADLGGAALV